MARSGHDEKPRSPECDAFMRKIGEKYPALCSKRTKAAANA